MRYVVRGYGFEKNEVDRTSEHDTLRAYIKGNYGYNEDLDILYSNDKDEWYIDLQINGHSVYATSYGVVDEEFKTTTRIIRRGFLKFGVEKKSQMRYVITDKQEEKELRKYISSLRKSVAMEDELNKLLSWKDMGTTVNYREYFFMNKLLNFKSLYKLQREIDKLEKDADYCKTQHKFANKNWWACRSDKEKQHELNFWNKMNGYYIDKEYYTREKIINLRKEIINITQSVN